MICAEAPVEIASPCGWSFYARYGVPSPAGYFFELKGLDGAVGRRLAVHWLASIVGGDLVCLFCV